MGLSMVRGKKLLSRVMSMEESGIVDYLFKADRHDLGDMFVYFLYGDGELSVSHKVMEVLRTCICCEFVDMLG